MLFCFASDVNQLYQGTAESILLFEDGVLSELIMSGVHLETTAPRILTGQEQMNDAGLPFGSEFIAA